MSKRLIAAFSVAGAAALGVWLKSKYQRRSTFEPDQSTDLLSSASSLYEPIAVHIDDDTAAEIISRARPALERAAKIQ